MNFSHSLKGRHFLPYIIAIVLSLGASKETQANVDSSAYGTPRWYSLTAQSTLISGLANSVFDDWEQGQSLGAGGTIVYWNCEAEMLITTYTGDDVKLMVGTNSTTPVDTFCTCHDIYMWRYGTPMPSSPTLPLYPDDSEFDLYPTAQGLYTIEVFPHGASTSTQALLTGLIVSIPQVTSMWVEANPICVSSLTSGDYYHFQVETDPPIESIINPPGGLGNVVVVPITATHAPVCEEIMLPPYNLQFNFNVYPCGDSALSGEINVTNTPSSSSTPVNVFPLDGYSGIDETNYYLSDAALNTAISGCTAPGIAPIIEVSYTDGVEYKTGGFVGSLLTPPNPINRWVPLLIEYPAVPASSYPGTSGPHTVGPPNATGVPFQSYDIYDYTVSGVETWTPTNNPIFNLYGGSTDGIIRIQDNLTIPAGTVLNLDSMRLEMGPGATINIETAASPTGAGGQLITLRSTLTAYRGCVDQTGTDASTWGGITVAGNSSWSYLGSGVIEQGYAALNRTTISYADVGIQNGTDDFHAGGCFNLIGGDTLYNNKIAINLWPHAGSELAEANGGAFITDNHASWFTPSSFVTINAAHGAYFDYCTFTNNSGHVMDDAISGLEATLGVDNCTFSPTGSTNSFKNGLMITATSGTHTVSIADNTFNNCQVGAAIYGSTAPALNGNTFNLPLYSGGSGGYSYVGIGGAYVVPDQVIGALIQGSSAFTLNGNIFQSTASSTAYQSGTLEYNTGSDNNQVTNNTFADIGVAMNSNYFNKSYVAGTSSGLQYTCNTDTHVGNDISVLGYDDGYATDGINPVQATYVPYSTTLEPTGNVFGSTTSNIYNTESPFSYYWYSSAPAQDPVHISGSCTPSSLSHASECYTITGIGPYSAASAAMLGSDATYASYYSNGAVGNVSFNYAMAAANLNYYMMDSVVHRDSIYYFAGQLNSPYGDLLTANLLIEDSLIDSANKVYNGIVNKYSLDSAEANDFTQGRYLEDILISLKESGGNVLTVSSSQIATLQSVAANSFMWAHARAEGWLYAINGTPIVDSLLYPVIPDSSGDGSRHANPNAQTSPQPEANKVYPNPVHDLLQVMYTATTNNAVDIQIQDITGQTVITQPLQSGVQGSVNMSALAPGMYLYRILEGAKVTMVGKVAKD